MEQNEQLNFIDELVRTYVEEAKEEYTKYSRLRELIIQQGETNLIEIKSG